MFVFRKECPQKRFYSRSCSLFKRATFDPNRYNIVPGDLSATLEAHRLAKNSKIRKYDYVKKNENKWSELHANKSLSTPFKRSTAVEIAENSPRPSRSETELRQLPHWSKSVIETRGQDKLSSLKIGSEIFPILPFELRRYNVETSVLPRPYAIRGFENKATQLTLELLEFAKYMRLTEAELQVRQDVSQELIGSILSKFPDMSFDLFGSHVTGLASTTSDVDISCSMTFSEGVVSEKLQMKQRILELTAFLAKFAHRYRLRMISRGRYPLIRLMHLPSGLEIQMVFSEKTLASSEYTKSYLEEFPTTLWPIYILLKSTLNARLLTASPKGGIGSYPLFMWIVASLKHTRVSRQDDVLQTLVKVLKFCSSVDTAIHGICIEPAILFEKCPSMPSPQELQKSGEHDPESLWRTRLGLINRTHPYLLCLQDPADISNDLGKSVFRILDIQKTFYQLYLDLQVFLDLEVSTGASPASPLDKFLGWHVLVVEQRRRTLQRFRDRQLKFELRYRTLTRLRREIGKDHDPESLQYRSHLPRPMKS